MEGVSCSILQVCAVVFDFHNDNMQKADYSVGGRGIGVQHCQCVYLVDFYSITITRQRPQEILMKGSKLLMYCY